MAKLKVNLACWDYDRTRALADGRVAVDGVDLNYIPLPVEETFFRMLRFKEFDAAELSLSSYSVSLLRDDPAFIAIPVFPSRFFRHSCIFVAAEAGITKPADLAGRRVGVPEYQMTAPVWIRGILQDEYGLAPWDVTHMTGGEEEPGREEKLKLNLPDKFKLVPIGPTETLAGMIAEQKIDGFFTARAPSTFYSRPDKVKRLFPNFVEIEKEYFKRTNIFPIMHVIVLRRDVYEKNRWLAQALFKAFEAAKAITMADLQVTAALKTSLPWQVAAREETVALMGEDWWSYGFAANRHVLDVFLRYHHEQGLSPRRLQPEELFAPETLEAFKI
jgi:4,5-dihydroxyphthalate decarboxylase